MALLYAREILYLHAIPTVITSDSNQRLEAHLAAFIIFSLVEISLHEKL